MKAVKKHEANSITDISTVDVSLRTGDLSSPRNLPFIGWVSHMDDMSPSAPHRTRSTLPFANTWPKNPGHSRSVEVPQVPSKQSCGLDLKIWQHGMAHGSDMFQFSFSGSMSSMFPSMFPWINSSETRPSSHWHLGAGLGLQVLRTVDSWFRLHLGIPPWRLKSFCDSGCGNNLQRKFGLIQNQGFL